MRCLKSLIYLASMAVWAMPAQAEVGPVILKSSDGTIELSGELLSFENDFYVIETDLGSLRVSTSLVFCEGENCPEDSATLDADLKVVGDETLTTTLTPLLITGYANHLGAEADTSLQGGVTLQKVIAEQGFGEEIATISSEAYASSAGLAALLEQEADIAFTSRRITRDEARQFSRAGVSKMINPENELVAALDSLVVIVHPDNPIEAITIDDLKRVFSGEITNWNELGGPDLAIAVKELGGSKTASQLFTDALGLANSGLFDAEEMDTDTETSIAVSNDPGAIGYVSLALQRQNRALSLIESCGIRHQPTRFNTKTEEYLLVRRLYAYNRSEVANDQKSGLLDFVRSQDADSLIAKAGFVDLGMERISLSSIANSQREFAQLLPDSYLVKQTESYLDEAAAWDRLSITFRFATASSRLDAKAERDVERLVSYLASLGEESSLAVVGFTDADGPDSANLVLGQQRAAAVQATLSARLEASGQPREIETMSFGELAPVRCNETSSGKANNRRVEIWIRG